jgi:ribosomal protein S18 acetylase RimI-like enzyme
MMVRRRIPSGSPADTSFRIREGAAADVPFVRDLSVKVFDQFGDYGAFLPGYIGHPAVFTAIGMADDTPVGFIMLALVQSQRPLPWETEAGGESSDDSLDAEVLAIAVSPALQSRGFGQRLMAYAVRCADEWRRAVGVRSIQLNVADTNHLAIRFFERMGFVEVDPEDGTYPMGQRSIRMARRL